MVNKISGLGRGLSSLIPQKQNRVSSAAVADAPSAVADGVLQVPVVDILPNPDQPRAVFRHHELEDLTNSIREHGVLQPLIVSRREGGYELIAGERRLRASKMLGLATVPVIVRNADGNQKLLFALIENIQREDLNPLEEARAYERLVSEFGFTQEDVAKRVGKARSTVANAMRLLALPREVQEAIDAGMISAGSARAILSLQDAKSQLKLFRKLSGARMSTREVEADARSAGGRQKKDPALLAAEEQLREKLGTRVAVTKRGGKGSIVISFYAEEEFESVLRKLLR